MVAAVMTSKKKFSTGGARRVRTPLSNEVREGVNGSGRVHCDTHSDGIRESHRDTPCDQANNPGIPRNGHACCHTVTYPQAVQRS